MYKCIVADPPWKFGDSLPGKSRGAAKQYKCMTVGEIMQFPLPPIADNAILFLWRVASMQQEALDVIKAWGFTLKSEIVWEKLTKTGKPWFGMGHFVRASHETCLIATRGKFKVESKSVRSRFEAAVPVDECGKYIHSAKPDEFFYKVENLIGPNLSWPSDKSRLQHEILKHTLDDFVPKDDRIELFARKRRPFWDASGDQLPPPVVPNPWAKLLNGDW